MEKLKGEERAFDQIENHGISTELTFDKKCKEERFIEMVAGKGFENFDRESTFSLSHLTESNISEIPNLEDEYSNTNQQEAVLLSLSRLESLMRNNSQPAESVATGPVPEFLVRARTNMYQLLTLVGSFAIALYSGLMVAMYEVSNADGSPQQLHKGTLIVSISSVVIFVCCVSGVGLFLVYQGHTADHPCKYLYVRLLRMTFFFTAFSSPFLLLTGLFVPTKQLWAPLFFTLYAYICTLLASAFLGIPTEPDSPAPTNDHHYDL